MERFINEAMEKISQRIPDADLFTIREILFFVSNDYEITPRSTELATVTDELPKEVKEYLVTKKIEGLSDSSLKQYHNALKRFYEKVRKPMHQIRTEDLRIYLFELLQESNMTEKSLENQRRYICSFFRWLLVNGYILKDPGASLAPIRCEKKIREPLTDTEMEGLRMACRTPREKAIIETLYSTGCRVTELTRIKISDIDFEKREVHLFGKGKKHRIAYLNARAMLNIRLLIGNRRFESEYVFATEREPHEQISTRQIEKIVKALGERAEISGRVFPHRIRHTTATDALRRGMAIEQVQQLLGHEMIATTLEYTKIIKEDIKEKHSKYIV